MDPLKQQRHANSSWISLVLDPRLWFGECGYWQLLQNAFGTHIANSAIAANWKCNTDVAVMEYMLLLVYAAPSMTMLHCFDIYRTMYYGRSGVW